MIKKTLYPKTKRINNNSNVIQITEKLDGSNIGFFKLNDDLIIAQRNWVFTLHEIQHDEKAVKRLYKGLHQWLKENAHDLLENLYEGSGFFAEWVGMGKIKYDFDTRVFIFAKANIDADLNVNNILYDLELLKYPFVNAEVPEYVRFVPQVEILFNYPTIEDLDVLYNNYNRIVNRNVEGFVVHQNGRIKKYVRMKNGKLEEHKEG